jgi:hypothetical protein
MSGDGTKRVRVGVIGTGVVAQVMHLHFLSLHFSKLVFKPSPTVQAAFFTAG